MCPAEGKKKRYVTRGRANLPNSRTMQWLNDEREQRGLSLRAVADAIGYRNAERVGKYFRLQIVPGSDMVRKLAIAVGVSPIEALWSSHHYSAVFDYFDKLYKLGWAWMHDDRLHLDERGAAFLLHYAPPAGTEWVEADLSQPPDTLAHRYHVATIYNQAGVFATIALPRPMACAILLAIGMFPRRGDKSQKEVPTFIRDLALVADEMLSLADVARVPSHLYHMRKPLKEAEKILPWRVYGTPMQLSIVAEYVHHWCDTVCKGYADFARVALYSEGGFVGDPHKNENLWQWQRAEIPSLDDLRLVIKPK